MLIYKTGEKEKGTSESDSVQKISLMRLSFGHENMSDVGRALQCLFAVLQPHLLFDSL